MFVQVRQQAFDALAASIRGMFALHGQAVLRMIGDSQSR